MPTRVEFCNLCGWDQFELLATRSDGIPVIRCTRCGHGTIAVIPDNPDAFYDDGYYSSPAVQEAGYLDYSYMAEHGVSWAAALIGLLRTGGRLLDIGCADGHLLNKVATQFECFGMEMNRHMADVCETRGFPVIGGDLMAPEIADKYRASFDAICAIAVFEHIVDFAGAVRVALELLRPGGVLLFEVPLISRSNDSAIWFRSSLEHIHYPDESALRLLIEQKLGAFLTGSECVLKDYGSTYIGIVRKDKAEALADQSLYERVVNGPVARLRTHEERRFRCLLELVHAAQSGVEVLPLLTDIEMNAPTVRRIAQIWRSDLIRLESRSDEVARQKAALTAEQGHSGELLKALSVRSGDAERLQEELDFQTGNATKLQEALNWQCLHAGRLQETLDAQRARIVDLQSAMVSKESEINQLQGQLRDEKADTGWLQEEFRSEKQEVDRLQDALGQYADRSAQLDKLLQAEENRVAGIRTELAEKNQRIRDLETSWSWRVTTPLRRVAGSASNCLNVILGPMRRRRSG